VGSIDSEDTTRIGCVEFVTMQRMRYDVMNVPTIQKTGAMLATRENEGHGECMLRLSTYCGAAAVRADGRVIVFRKSTVLLAGLKENYLGTMAGKAKVW
jgi:hypothetical protein